MITYKLIESLESYGKTMSTFKHSQDLRSTYLHEARKAGELLMQVQDLFKSEGYCTAKPLEVAGGSYTSFKGLLKDFANVYTQLIGDIPEGLEEYFNESHASKCMTLARRWSEVCEIVDMFSTKHTYRLSKTLEIVAWYMKKKADNPTADPTQFTCKLYWEEQEQLKEARRVEKQQKEHELRETYSRLKSKYENLQVEFSVTVTQMQTQITKLESELKETKLKLASIKPFSPPVVETPRRAPVFS